MSRFFNEMYAPEGGERPPYRDYAAWLRGVAPETLRRKQADRSGA